ncbi:MAG: hypothetical protein OEZ06_01115 [Myxococcales bacterium]|nr:hypothetical protein [Myxococcales bacterium]
MPDPRGQIKGAAFREFVLWYEREHDACSVVEAIAAVEREFPSTFEPDREGRGILVSQWYPATVVHALIDQILKGHLASELDALAAAAAEEIMGHTLRGVYKFIFSSFANPELYARHVNKLWNLHYDSGRCAIEPVTSGRWVAHYDGWTAHHPFICKMNMASTVPIYATMGCRNVRWRKLSCIADGASRCSSEFSFER